MNNKDTILIIGGSRYLNSIKEHIPYWVKLFNTIGINYNALTYHTSHCAFLDIYLKDKLLYLDPKTYIITTTNNYNMQDVFKNGEYRDSFYNKNYKEYNHNDKYACFGFTHDYAISWSIAHNFKNVVMIGAADFEGNLYNHDKFTFNRSPKIEKISVDGISDFFVKYINIYTMNPNSKLRVPRLTVKDIYKIGLTKS